MRRPPVLDEDAIPVEIGLRAVRELRYVLFALVLLVSVITGDEATFNVE